MNVLNAFAESHPFWLVVIFQVVACAVIVLLPILSYGMTDDEFREGDWVWYRNPKDPKYKILATTVLKAFPNLGTAIIGYGDTTMVVGDEYLFRIT